MTTISVIKFYHGGVPGLEPGDLIHPPSVTKSETVAGRRAIGSAKRKYRDDRVAADSAYTNLKGKLTTDTNATTGLTPGAFAATTDCTLVLYDAAGNA